MQYENIIVDGAGPVGWLTVNRPQQLNALNAAVLREMQAGVEQLANTDGVRALVLTGSGAKAFIAGADIKAMAAMDAAQAKNFVQLGHACMNAIERTPQPVIAMVNGFALGGGCEVALACDFIIASENAKLGLPEVTLGLFPGFGGTQRLLKLVGKARALELICTGRQLTAQEACAWGVVNRVVPQAELRGVVEALAVQIAKNSPAAVRAAKKVILQGLEGGLSAGLAAEQAAFPECFTTDDCTEGLAAFVERRAAQFTGR